MSPSLSFLLFLSCLSPTLYFTMSLSQSPSLFFLSLLSLFHSVSPSHPLSLHFSHTVSPLSLSLSFILSSLFLSHFSLIFSLAFLPLSFSHSPSLSLSLSLSPSFSLTLSLAHSLSLSLFPSFSLTLSLAHSLLLSLSLSRPLFLSLSPTNTGKGQPEECHSRHTADSQHREVFKSPSCPLSAPSRSQCRLEYQL